MVRGPGFYSRLVAILKVGLPLLALVLIASMFLISTENDFEGGIVFGEGDLAALGEGLRITHPVLTGATRTQDPFRFTAEVVVPDAAPPTRAAITALDGTVDFVGGPSVAVTAPEAEIDLDAQVMRLLGRARVASDDGLVVLADRIEIDLLSGAVTALGAVDGRGPMGTIAAGEARVVPAEGESGRRVFSFENAVRLVYRPGHETED